MFRLRAQTRLAFPPSMAQRRISERIEDVRLDEEGVPWRSSGWGHSSGGNKVFRLCGVQRLQNSSSREVPGGGGGGGG